MENQRILMYRLRLCNVLLALVLVSICFIIWLIISIFQKVSLNKDYHTMSGSCTNNICLLRFPPINFRQLYSLLMLLAVFLLGLFEIFSPWSNIALILVSRNSSHPIKFVISENLACFSSQTSS